MELHKFLGKSNTVTHKSVTDFFKLGLYAICENCELKDKKSSISWPHSRVLCFFSFLSVRDFIG